MKRGLVLILIFLGLIADPSFNHALAFVTIESTAYSYSDAHDGNIVVFISDTTGYVFYIDSSTNLCYKKTTDSGATWGSKVTIASAENEQGVDVWYDRWTPGDTTGNYIHISYMSVNGYNKIYYSRFDTTGDTYTTPVSTMGASTGNVLSVYNSFSITKATDGVLYMALEDNDGSASFVNKCSSSCDSAGNWSSSGTDYFSNTLDGHIRILPLADGDIMGLEWNVSTSKVNYSIYDTSAGTWSSLTELASATYYSDWRETWGATVNRSNNDIYFFFNSYSWNLSGDIEFWVYNGSSWTQKKNKINNQRNGTIKASYDEANDRLYTVKLNASVNNDLFPLYTSYSDDLGKTWFTEEQISGTQSYNNRTVSVNLMSDERIYAVWFNRTDNKLYGDTVVDL